jgi:hypothetical protein
MGTLVSGVTPSGPLFTRTDSVVNQAVGVVHGPYAAVIVSNVATGEHVLWITPEDSLDVDLRFNADSTLRAGHVRVFDVFGWRVETTRDSVFSLRVQPLPDEDVKRFVDGVPTRIGHILPTPPARSRLDTVVYPPPSVPDDR